MKEIKIFTFFCFTLLFFSCNKKTEFIETIGPTDLDILEKRIREKQDQRAYFSFADYEKLLDVLDNEKFIVLPLDKFKDSINKTKVLIGLRHDIDCHPFKALKMAKMEKAHHMKVSYFLLASAPYCGEFIDGKLERYLCVNDIYQEISNLGHEIGIHNDLISLMVLQNINPYLFNQEEISFYKSLGIEIKGTAAHGSYITLQTVDNYEIFSDFATTTMFTFEGKNYQIGNLSLKDYGFDYEANFIDFDHYYSDTRRAWTENGEYDEFLEKLNNSTLGTKIQILIHPVWWGKE